jgi:hypothetical protein
MQSCGHCKDLLEGSPSIWDQVRQKLLSLHQRFDFIDPIESMREEEDLSRLNQLYNSNVQLQSGYPTIFRIRLKNGDSDYFDNGQERDVDSLVNWLTEGKENDIVLLSAVPEENNEQKQKNKKKSNKTNKKKTKKDSGK